MMRENVFVKITKKKKRWETGSKKRRKYLQNGIAIPEERVGMEASSGIKPKRVPLLSISSPVHINVCLNKVWFSRHISQEFKI